MNLSPIHFCCALASSSLTGCWTDCRSEQWRFRLATKSAANGSVHRMRQETVGKKALGEIEEIKKTIMSEFA